MAWAYGITDHGEYGGVRNEPVSLDPECVLHASLMTVFFSFQMAGYDDEQMEGMTGWVRSALRFHPPGRPIRRFVVTRKLLSPLPGGSFITFARKYIFLTVWLRCYGRRWVR